MPYIVRIRYETYVDFDAEGSRNENEAIAEVQKGLTAGDFCESEATEQAHAHMQVQGYEVFYKVEKGP